MLLLVAYHQTCHLSLGINYFFVEIPSIAGIREIPLEDIRAIEIIFSVNPHLAYLSNCF